MCQHSMKLLRESMGCLLFKSHLYIYRIILPCNPKMSYPKNFGFPLQECLFVFSLCPVRCSCLSVDCTTMCSTVCFCSVTHNMSMHEN